MKKTKLVISSLLGLGISAFVIPTITSCSSHAMNIDVNISQAQIAEVNSAAEGTVASFEELNIGQLNIVDGYQHFQTSSPFFNLKDIYDEKIDVISVWDVSFKLQDTEESHKYNMLLSFVITLKHNIAPDKDYYSNCSLCFKDQFGGTVSNTVHFTFTVHYTPETNY